MWLVLYQLNLRLYKDIRRDNLMPRAGVEPARPKRSTDFLTTITFATRKKIGLWSGRCLLHTSIKYLQVLRREPSRLYTLLATLQAANLSSALPSALPVKASPTLTPFTLEFPTNVLKSIKSVASAIPPPRH
jgi:hypothetical protein